MSYGIENITVFCHVTHVTTCLKGHVTWLLGASQFKSPFSQMLIGLKTAWDLVIKCHMTLWLGAPNPQSPLCQVWCLSGNVVFILSHGVMWPHIQTEIWLDNWKQLNTGHHSTKFDGYYMEVEIKRFHFATWLHGTSSKGHGTM